MITVMLEKGEPAKLTIGKRHFTVNQIQDSWIIEEEWWRQTINRQYFALLVDNGAIHTIFHDRLADTWYAQEY